MLLDVKSRRTWGWRAECVRERAFSRSRLTLEHSWVLFLLKTKEELKAEKIPPLAAHGFVCHPSLYCMNKQQLFIHLISPSTPSANKCKQIHNATASFYCCHPPRQNHWYMFFLKAEQLWEMQWMQQLPTGNNMHLTQSFILAQWVFKSYIFLRQMKNLPGVEIIPLLLKDFLESRRRRSCIIQYASVIFFNFKNVPEP